MNNPSFNKGLFFALLGFSVWGVLPLYWKMLERIDPLHILAFRILFSLVVVGTILFTTKNFTWLTLFRNPKKGALQVLTGLLLCNNWGLYVWAVNTGRTIEGSLGYYINPLVSIVLGMIFFREKLSVLQKTAFGLAVLGVLVLTLFSGTLPWISIVLAVSFGFYGLLKKSIELPAMESLAAETLGLVPLGFFLLFFRFDSGGLVSGWQSLSYLPELPLHTLISVSLIGFISPIPLYCFAKAARLLPLSTLGFLQFLSPTCQFLLGYFVFAEFFPPHYFAAFAFIWLAAILYVISLKKPQPAEKQPND